MALVLVLAVGAQWLGWRLRLPALLFLLAGFSPSELVQHLTVFALAVAEVHDGHLTLRWVTGDVVDGDDDRPRLRVVSEVTV